MQHNYTACMYGVAVGFDIYIYVPTNLTCVLRVPFYFFTFYFFRDGNVEKSDQMRDGEADLGRHKARKGH